MSDWKKLRELAEAATPGPWELWTSNSVRRITAEGQQDGGVLSAILCGPDRQPDLHGRNRERDLEYVVAANPQTILALLDENDSLRAQIASLEFQLAEEQRLGVSRLQALIDGNRDRDKLRAEIRGLQKALKDASNDRDRCLAALFERSIGKDGGNG